MKSSTKYSVGGILLVETYVIGAGMTKFGKFKDMSVKELSSQAITNALQDAGIDKKDLQAAYVSNTFWGRYSEQHSIKGEVILRAFGIDEIPIINTENACAGASTALHLAWTGLKSGLFDVVLALGVEKLTHEDKEFALRSFDSCVDVEKSDRFFEQLLIINQKHQLLQNDSSLGQGRSIFMDVYAFLARWHMEKYGSTQKQLAIISSKNHEHGYYNPLAQIRKKMNVEEILADKEINYPITRAMCSPIGDGAAAVILCSKDYLKKIQKGRPVKLLASIIGSGRDRKIDEEHVGKKVSKKAYEMSGLGPEDVDLAELHDATAFGELIQTENMGFCKEGEGGIMAEKGETKLGGKLPINTSGGLECRGHPIGASGLAQVFEIVMQLRGEAGERQVNNARTGLTENGGGFIGLEEAAVSVNIFQKYQ